MKLSSPLLLVLGAIAGLTLPIRPNFSLSAPDTSPIVVHETPEQFQNISPNIAQEISPNISPNISQEISPNISSDNSQNEWQTNPQPTTAGDTRYAIPGVVAPLCYDEAQQPLNRCVGRWLQTTELLHELVYDEIAVPLTEPMRSRLDAVHQTWMQFRDEHCDLASFQLLGGSAYPMSRGSCRAGLTNERIAALQFWGEVTTDEATADQQMQDAYSSLDVGHRPFYSDVKEYLAEGNIYYHRDTAPSLEVAQQRWLEYREAHCNFEAAYITTEADVYPIRWTYRELQDLDEPTLQSQCRARLTMERIEQLENIGWLGW